MSDEPKHQEPVQTSISLNVPGGSISMLRRASAPDELSIYLTDNRSSTKLVLHKSMQRAFDLAADAATDACKTAKAKLEAVSKDGEPELYRQAHGGFAQAKQAMDKAVGDQKAIAALLASLMKLMALPEPKKEAPPPEPKKAPAAPAS